MTATELTPTEVAAVRAVARLGRLAERSLGELSLAHYRVLSAIAGGDERASRVAERFALGKPAVSVTVDALARTGLITKQDGADDQRVTTLTLTPEGERVLAAAEQSLTAAVHEILDHADTPGLIDALAAIGKAVEEHARVRHEQQTATPRRGRRTA